MSDAGPHRPSGFGVGGRRRRRGRRGGGGGGVGLARPHGGGGSQPARQVRLADAPIPDGEPTLETRGVLQVAAEGYGFLRSAVNDFNVEPLDPWVPREIVQSLGLETGVEVEGLAVPGARPGAGPGVARVLRLNGVTPEEYAKRTAFKNLVAEDPTERIRLEFDPAETSTRVVDLIAPIGKGQRCLIVAPPKAGKTVLLQKIAKAITSNHPEIHLIVLLVDERPEEVTDMRRNVRGEVIASSSDELARNHLQVAEIALERAKRLVEIGRDVVVLLDSITRLSRAYNTEQKGSGRVLSGGIDARTMEKPRRFFGAARKAVSGGSLTVIGTALVDTGSRMDEVIFQEFKGTGNMEIHLDRRLMDRRMFPAMDVTRSGTRKEELLLPREVLNRVWILRKLLTQLNTVEAMEFLHDKIKGTKVNQEFLDSMSH